MHEIQDSKLRDCGVAAMSHVHTFAMLLLSMMHGWNKNIMP